MISSAMLAAEDPLQSDTPRNEVSMQYSFTWTRTQQYLIMLYLINLEMLLYVFSSSLNKNAVYLKPFFFVLLNCHVENDY
jgi:hypothetical protein